VPVTESLMDEVVGAKTYTVLDRAYVDQVLSEQEFDLSAMVSDTQIAQVGQFLAADYVTTGKVQMLGDSYFLVAKMIEVKTGVIVWQASTQGDGKLTALIDMAHSLGKKLVAGASTSLLKPTGDTGGESAAGAKIGLSFPDFSAARWPSERDQMTQLLKAAGCEVIVEEAQSNARRQGEQIKDMAARGAKVIIVVPADSRALAPAVDELSARGVKIIAYDRLIATPDISAYVSFDNVAIGRSQAIAILAIKSNGNFVLLGGSRTDNNAFLFRKGQMEVLKPLIDSGKIKIVADQWIDGWNPAGARAQMSTILAETKGKVDAVVAPNDLTALGAIMALKDSGMAGKVPISGQDATEAGCNSIARGELSVTVFKDIRRLVPLVCDYAIRLATGKDIPELSPCSLVDLTGDQAETGSVPCLFLPALPVTKDNLKRLVVDSGFQPYEGVYKGVKDAPAK
jgi:D-xylose transport system substrate-binding protein